MIKPVIWTLGALFSMNSLLVCDQQSKSSAPIQTMTLDQQFDAYETDIFYLHKYYKLTYSQYGPTTVFATPYYMTAVKDSTTGNTIVMIDRGGMDIKTDERVRRDDEEVSMLYLDSTALAHAFLSRGIEARMTEDKDCQLVWEQKHNLVPLLQDTIHYKKYNYQR